MLDDSSNVFLPGLTVTQDMDNKQPESTYTLPTSSIAVLANAQPAYPLDVKFRVIEDSVKTEFVQLLSNPNTFLPEACINSFMVNTCILSFVSNIFSVKLLGSTKGELPTIF